MCCLSSLRFFFFLNDQKEVGQILPLFPIAYNLFHYWLEQNFLELLMLELRK